MHNLQILATVFEKTHMQHFIKNNARCMFHAFNIFQMLDLSYNNLSQDDLLTLGTLPNLKILHLTGNNFHTIPMDFALPYVDRETLVFIL